MSVKFVHCADIHLDSPFALSGIGEGEKRRTELRSAFASLIMETKRYGADIMFIAGDLFEDEYVTKDTMLLIANELESLGKCRVFITPGNHDPYSGKSPYALVRMPDNVRIFTSEQIENVYLEELDVRVYGHAYNTPHPEIRPLAGFTKDLGNSRKILVTHSVITDGFSPYSAISEADIERSGFDYIALGHIHSHDGLHRLGKTYYCYSGCLEGRDFGECGHKGAVFGAFTEDGVKVETRRFSNRRYEKTVLDVTGIRNPGEFAAALTEACSGYGRDTALRITFEGVCAGTVSITETSVRRFVTLPYLLEIDDRTVRMLDEAELERDGSFLGEFYRALKPKLVSENEAQRKTARRALEYGIAAFSSVKKR